MMFVQPVVGWLTRICSTWASLLFPVDSTVMVALAALVPVWLDATVMVLPLALAPAMAAVTVTVLPDAEAV
jgi:hypothetical protein